MPHKGKEVEIKFRVDNPRHLSQRLRAAGFRRVTPPTYETNVLYDLPGQKLRHKGELLRLRKYGSTWLLTHKAKSQTGRHKSRVETETQVADGIQIDTILRALGLSSTFRYEKYRAEWTDGKGLVVVDETPIGIFAEIEGPPRWIDQTARQLGVARSDYIALSYAPLFLAWKDRTHSSATNMTFEETRQSPAPSRKRVVRRSSR